MEIQTAIEILSYHQEWRLGKREDMIHEPKKLTEALDMILTEVKKLHKPDVSGNEANPKNKQSGEVALLLVQDEDFWNWVDLRYERFMKRWELNAQPEKGNWDTFELYERYNKEKQQQ